MRRFGLFWLPGLQCPEDVAAKYDFIITYRRPKVVREGTTVLGSLCVDDAWGERDDAPSPQGKWWSSLVIMRQLFAKDASGHRIAGWGPGRYAVDLSLTGPWADMIFSARAAAIQAGLDGLHIDSGVSVRPYEMGGHDPIAPRNGLATWARNAQLIAEALANAGGSRSLNGGKLYYTPLDMMDCFHFIKFEDRYVTESGKATLRDWIEGREGWSPGILAMEAVGHDVVWDCFVPTRFSKAEVDAYAETRLATMMLTDRGRLCLHGNDEHGPDAYPGPWARTPIWTPAHDMVERLGGPLGTATKMGNGGYWRQYTHGKVYVNPTDAPIQQNVGRVKIALPPVTGRILEGV